jgi:hypothetical protein
MSCRGELIQVRCLIRLLSGCATRCAGCQELINQFRKDKERAQWEVCVTHSRLKCPMLLSLLSNIITQTHRRQVTAEKLEIGRHWNEPKWRHARSPTGKASKPRRRARPSWYFHLSAICVHLLSEPSRLLVPRTANLTPQWICICIAYHTCMRRRMCMRVCVH